MSRLPTNHSAATLKDVLELISDFGSGNFSRTLGDTEDPILKPIVERLNATTRTLAAKSQSQGLDQYQFLERVLSFLPGLVSYLDRNLRYLYVNEAYERWFGISKEECLRSTMHDVIGSAGVDAVKSYLDAALNGVAQEFERQIPYKHGVVKTIHVQYIPDQDPSGNICGIIALVHDITRESSAIAEKNRSSLKGIEDRARLDALFLQSTVPIMTLAPPTWKFTRCNPAALKLLEVENEETFIRLGPWDLSPENQPDGRASSDIAPLMIQTAMNQGSHLFNWTHKTMNGKEISCKVLLSRIDTQGHSYLQAIVQDISKEQAALIELRDKTEELSSIYLNAPVGILELDHNLQILRCNPAYEKILGYSREELVGRSMVDFTHPDDKVISIEKAKSVALTASQFECFEKRYITKSGNTVWVKIAGRVLRDSKNSAKYLSVVEDITNQKANEVELHTILETMADGLIIQDGDAIIEKANPSALSLLGLSKDQVVGHTSLDPRHQATQEDGTPLAEDQHPALIALKTGKPVMGSLMGLKLPNGASTWIRINAIPFDSPSGRKVACTLSDVTELLNTQREIRFVLDALKIGVWKFNPVSQQLYWDDSMYKVFDLCPTDFTGHYQAWESTLTPESKAKAVEELSQALRGENEFNTVFEIETRSKGRRFISGQGTVIRDSALNPIMMYGLNADVTDQVKITKELELERAKSLRSAKLASLGEMSAGIAHEINNPLAIISGAAGLLARYADDPEKLAGKIETIKRSCDRIARIVSGLRKFSRTGDKPNFQIHDLATIVKEVITLVELKSKQHSTPVTFECETTTKILCDEVEIEQVLVNLINNAIDAVKNRPDRWVKLIVSEELNQAVLRVIDSGPGIPDTIRNRLFDPFFTTKKTGEGTGLGLSITKGILDEHKATITVVPEFPHTCFEIKFPILEATPHAA